MSQCNTNDSTESILCENIIFSSKCTSSGLTHPLIAANRESGLNLDPLTPYFGFQIPNQTHATINLMRLLVSKYNEIQLK